MTIDLHVHSVYSVDAHELPDSIFRHAREEGIRTVVLAEHDTLDSLPAALEASARHGVETFPGIEFFADARVVGMESLHLLAYLFDPEDAAFRELMARVTAAGRAKWKSVLAGLAEKGIIVGQEALLEEQRKTYPEAVGRAVTGTHEMGLIWGAFSTALKKAGRERLIGAEKIAMLPCFPIEEILPVVRAAGGLTMWAHPLIAETPRAAQGTAPGPVQYWLDYFPDQPRRASLDELMAEFKAIARRLFELGLDGFEAYSYMHDSEMLAALLEFAKESGRPCSGGSDAHYRRQLGRVRAPCDVLDRMREYRDRRTG